MAYSLVGYKENKQLNFHAELSAAHSGQQNLGTLVRIIQQQTLGRDLKLSYQTKSKTAD